MVEFDNVKYYTYDEALEIEPNLKYALNLNSDYLLNYFYHCEFGWFPTSHLETRLLEELSRYEMLETRNYVP